MTRGEPKMQNDSIHDFFKAYASCYDYYQHEPLLRYFTLPCMIIHEDHLQSFEDLDSLSDNLAKIMVYYKKTRLKRAAFKIQNSIPLDANHYLIQITWELHNNKGIFSEFTCYYQLVFQRQAWRIAVVTNLEEKFTSTKISHVGPKPHHYPGFTGYKPI